MKVVRFTKTASEHPTVLLCNDEDPHLFRVGIDRSEDGRLRFRTEDYCHTYELYLTPKEEAELLEKLKFIP